MKRSVFSALPAVIGMAGLVALAVGMTSAIAAEPEASAATADKNETIIIKMVKRDGDSAKAGDKEHMAKIMSDCGMEKATVDSESETKDANGKVKHSRIIICNRSAGIDNEALVKRLEEARKQVADVTELSGDAKAKALASLDAEIARLKSAK